MSLFLPVIDAFNREKVAYVVVGGLAVVLHGHARLTADVDLVIGLDEANASKAVEIVSRLGYRPRAPVDPKGFADSKTRTSWIKEKGLKEKGLMVFSFHKSENPMIGIDFFVDYPMEFKGLLARSVIKVKGGQPLKVDPANEQSFQYSRADPCTYSKFSLLKL